jgi:hypothetical protein
MMRRRRSLPGGRSSGLWSRPVGRAAVTLCALTLASSACAHVAPYERERLAHRSMLETQYIGPAESHVRAVQEGAIGGQLEAVSGCGCN